MGRTYQFECEKCGCRVKVAGGAAEGLDFTVQSILCYQCREFQDAVISLKVPWPPVVGDASAGAKLKATPKTAEGRAVVRHRGQPPAVDGAHPRAMQHFKPLCSVSALHRIREWNQPDKCPRCGVFLAPN